MKRLKTHIRGLVAGFLHYTGINSLYRSLTRKKALVLMYHRVLDNPSRTEGYVQPGMYVTKDVFEMHAEYLSRNYDVVGVDEFLKRLEEDRGPRGNVCLLTFDDGWKDNYTNALPALKKHNVPATIFLVSDFVGTGRRFWEDSLVECLSLCIREGLLSDGDDKDYPSLKESGLWEILGKRNLALERKIELAVDSAKRLEPEVRTGALEELERLAMKHKRPVKPAILNWDEVREMTSHAVGFGSHTSSHSILTGVPVAELEGELASSKKKIEDMTSAPCDTFCYPNGDYDERVKDAVRKHYKCAFTTEKGFVCAGDDPYALKRIGVHNDVTYSKALFACRISGLMDTLGL